MANKLPSEAEAIRQKYLRALQENVVEPFREDLEGQRRRALNELHRLEESADPLVADDSRMMSVGLEKRLNRVDLADHLLEGFRQEFQQLGTTDGGGDAAAGSERPRDEG